MVPPSAFVHAAPARPLKVPVVIAIAFVAAWLVKRAITRFVSRLQGEPARQALDALREGEVPEDTEPLRLRRAQRAETVAALLSSVSSLVIWLLAFMTILSQV